MTDDVVLAAHGVRCWAWSRTRGRAVDTGMWVGRRSPRRDSTDGRHQQRSCHHGAEISTDTAVSVEMSAPVDGAAVDPVLMAELYACHVHAVLRFARGLTGDRDDADDLVAEGFVRTWTHCRSTGLVPRNFRAYWCVVIRNIRHTALRRERRIDRTVEVEDAIAYGGVTVAGLIAPSAADVAAVADEAALIGGASGQLPARWRAVLRLTEIEGMRPTEAAHVLGLTANAVSALAYRAREGLRRAYLRAHIAPGEGDCVPVIDQLGAWVRDSLPRRARDTVDTHMGGCGPCRAATEELVEVNRTMAPRRRPNGGLGRARG